LAAKHGKTTAQFMIDSRNKMLSMSNLSETPEHLKKRKIVLSGKNYADAIAASQPCIY